VGINLEQSISLVVCDAVGQLSSVCEDQQRSVTVLCCDYAESSSLLSQLVILSVMPLSVVLLICWSRKLRIVVCYFDTLQTTTILQHLTVHSC
jgi:hypothetical protein